jgi:FtsZ-interacting cell division protein ZipA
MSQHQLLIILVVIAVIVLVAIVVLALRKRRSQKLRERFGPEYERVVRQEGNAQKAESVLEFREKRREKLKIRPLSATDKSNFEYRWSEVQRQFVDDPRGAVTLADSLITDVMQTRGYPMGDFDQRTADISVDHPVVVENYRTAHEIAVRHSSGQASTEDLRKAMVHYKTLFHELVHDDTLQRKGA